MPARVCRTCGSTKDEEAFAVRIDRGVVSRRRVCTECRNEHFRTLPHRNGTGKNKKVNIRKWLDKNPEKKRAESYFNWYSKSQNIQRQPCVLCGNPSAVAHHPDYSRRLYVAWLCRKDHGAVHAGRIVLLPAACIDYSVVERVIHVPDRKGEKSGCNKVTADDVRVIRELRALGCRPYQIAWLYRISNANATLIVKRKNWSHIE